MKAKKIAIWIVAIIAIFSLVSFIAYRIVINRTITTVRTEVVSEVRNFVPNSPVGEESSQWRGFNRDGVYHEETGLLTTWPVGGPELLWYVDKLGDGYSSPAIANGRIYITGLHADDLVLSVFNLNGELLARRIIGREWASSYPGSRATITVNDGHLYVFNSLGHIICLNEKTLEQVWKRDVLRDFDGRNIRWGMTESPLIIGDKIIVTPGGRRHNVVALNKKTGELVWSSQALGEQSSYCSPLFIDGYSVPLIVTNTERHIIGLNANTGELLWSHPQTNTHNIHPNTPLYSNGMIFSTTGYGGGSVMLRLTNNGKSVEQVWRNDVDNQMGGAVKVGNTIFTSGHRNRGFFAIDWNTGAINYSVRQISPSAIVAADGMLFVYSDRGEVALVRPNPNNFELVSSFHITHGTNQHWAHPVIHDGVLYIRRGDALMAFAVR